MARLKFLVFALLVIAVWSAHLVLLPPPLVARSVELAMAQAQGARPLAEAQISERRQLLQRTALKLGAHPKLAALVQALRPPTPKEAVPADKLQPLRALADEQASEEIRSSLVVGYTTEGGGTFFRGAEPAEGLDAALGKAGQDGMVQEAFGVSHLFVSLPVWDRTAPEPKQVGSIVLGAPLLTDGMMEAVTKDAALAGAGLFQGGRLVQHAGVDKALMEQAAKLAQPGKGTPVEFGATGSLGPLKLPLFTSADDRMGGRAPLLVASRQAIEDTPYEFITLASVRPMMAALGGYQQFALGALAVLLVLTLAWAALMGSGEASAVEEEEDETGKQMLPLEPREAEPPAEEAAPELKPPPEPALASTMPDSSEPGDPRLARAIAQLGGGGQEGEVPPTPSVPFEPIEPPPEPATTAEPDLVPPPGSPYDIAPPPEDPFAQYQSPAMPDSEGTGRVESPFAAAGHDLSQEEPETQEPPTAAPPLGRAYPQETVPHFSSDPFVPVVSQDDSPDATRVSAVPPELLEASARTARPNTLPSARQSGSIPLPRMPAVPAATHVVSPEEQHFQETYREFVATRERCGEGADGLTYEKFAAKLRKNKEQLVQKYACKTVRFQVYVKEGKAALKATPVKD